MVFSLVLLQIKAGNLTATHTQMSFVLDTNNTSLNFLNDLGLRSEVAGIENETVSFLNTPIENFYEIK